jgi:hypothetical protein
MKTATANHERPDASAVLRFCNDVLPDNAREAIEHCAKRGDGERRNIRAIIATAEEFDADPRVVAAAFLFLPNMIDASAFVDVTDRTHDETADLPDDLPVFAAFALARLALGGAELVPIAFTPH